MDRTKRIKAIKTDGVSLTSSEKPVDYGHCGEIFKDKYGEVRGAKMYQDFIDMSGNSSARFFVVAEKILKEKKAMLRVLGWVGPASIYEYEQLFDAWQLISPVRKDQEHRGHRRLKQNDNCLGESMAYGDPICKDK